MAGGSKITTTAPWDEQQDFLKTGFQRAEDLYGRGMPKYYTGETLAGFDPEQRRAQASVLNYARGPRVGAMQGGAERALLSKLSGQTPFTNQQTSDLLAGTVNTGEGTPYGDLANVYRQQAEDQMSQGLSNVRQGLVGSANMPVQPGGGSRGDLAQERILGQGQKAIAQNLAQMYGGAYQQAQGQRFPMAQMGIGQQTAGMGAYPTIMGAPMGMYGAMADVGAQRRSMAQETINRDMQKYQYEAGAPQSALQNYLASVTGDYGSVVTAPGKDYTGNILGMLAGALG
tara:strand:- start:566 stop:1423 length:858 start_codon:yes stop_codon:yes gene_type:complete